MRYAQAFFGLGPLPILYALITAAIALWKASGQPEIYDEGAYHLPLIRMWEIHGLVPGFANLNGHFGLNSHWHILHAFCNLDFLPGFGYTFGLNGFMAALLGLYAAKSMHQILKNKALVSDWMNAVLPILVFRNILSSPSTDIPAIIASWFIFSFWLKAAERSENMVQKWPIFSLLPVWVLVLKTSSGALILAPLFFWAQLWLKGERQQAWGFILLSFIQVLPWLVQNWLLTGYLIFPLKLTALGNPLWQVPETSIDVKFYFEQFGAFAPPSAYTWAWLKTWFFAHNADTRAILILALFGWVLLAFRLSIKKSPNKRLQGALFLTLSACIASWLLTVTEPRYGFGALVILALFPLGLFFQYIKTAVGPRAGYLLVLFLALQGWNLIKTWKEDRLIGQHWIAPAPRPLVAFKRVNAFNFQAQTPVSYHGQYIAGKPVFCWDCPLPCIPKENLQDTSFIATTSVMGRLAFYHK